MQTPAAFPVDYDAIRAALVLATEAACGLEQGQVITAEPEVSDQPRPAKPYLTLKIMTSGTRYGSDAYVPQNDDGGLHDMVGPRAMTVSFNSYGNSHEEAASYMVLLQARLGGDVRLQEDLARAGVAVWKPGAVADLSQLVNTAYEGRAHMDVTFGITSMMTVDLGVMKQATAVGSVDGTPVE